MRLVSQVIVSTDRDKTIAALEALRTDEFITKVIKDDALLVDDAKLIIEKAYLATSVKNIIIVAAKAFPPLIQNKLLKIIEEPPKNVEFIIIVPTKAIILPTIRSRLPIITLREERTEEELGLDLVRMNLATVYEFIQANKRIDNSAAKELVQRIGKAAILTGAYDLDEKSLELLSDSYKALDVGSSPQFVLTTLLFKLLARKRKG